MKSHGFLHTLLTLSLFVNQALALGITDGKTATSSSTYNTSYPASKAIDGVIDNSTDSLNYFRSEGSANQWWMVDLGEPYFIVEFTAHRQAGPIGGPRFQKIYLVGTLDIGSNSHPNGNKQNGWERFSYKGQTDNNFIQYKPPVAKLLRYLAVYSEDNQGLVLSEVTVYGYDRRNFKPSNLQLNTSSQFPFNVICSWDHPQPDSQQSTIYAANFTARFDNDTWQSVGKSNRQIMKSGVGPYTSVRCEVKVENATGTASAAIWTPCTAPTIPRNLRFIRQNIQLKSGRDRWLYNVRWEISVRHNCRRIRQPGKAYETRFPSFDSPIVLRGHNNPYRLRQVYIDGAVTVSFFVRACNDENLCSEYVMKNITTPPLRPQLSPDNTSSSTHNASCLQINWQPPMYANGIISSYEYNCTNTILLNVSGTVREAKVCGYDPYSNVTCNLRARNSAGVSDDAIITGKTGCAVPALNTDISDYLTEGRDQDGRELRLDIPSDHVHPNCQSIHSITYNLNNTDQSAGENNGHIRGLEAVTNYQVAVKITNNMMLETLITVFITTGELPPGPVEVYAVNENTTCIAVSWSSPEKPNGLISEYQYRCSTVDAQISPLDNWRNTGLNQNAVSCGHVAGEYVICEAKASTSEGFGEANSSNTIQVQCARPSLPGVTLDDETHMVNGTERVRVVISWLEPESYCDNIQSYSVELRMNDMILLSYTGLDRNVRVENLEPYTNYTLDITATNNHNLSSVGVWHNRTRELRPYDPPVLQTNTNASCVTMDIRPPGFSNGVISNYLYHCDYEEEGGTNSSYLNVKASDQSTVTDVCGFTSASLILCTVSAINSAGESPQHNFTLYTELKVDELTLQPTLSTHGETTRILISAVELENKKIHISKYRVIIFQGKERQFNLSAVEQICNKSQHYNSSYAGDLGLPCYVAAELAPFNGTTEFIIGSREEDNGYRNEALVEGNSYVAVVAVIYTPKVDEELELTAYLTPLEFGEKSSDLSGQVSEAVPVTPDGKFKLRVGLGTGLPVVILIGVGVVVATLMYKRRENKPKEERRSLMLTDIDGHREEGTSYENILLAEKRVDTKKSSISIVGFENYVLESCDIINQQYKTLEAEPKPSMSVALLPTNAGKSRYRGLYPGDDTRVLLDRAESEGGDFINASYIAGYSDENKFIAAQGPMLSEIRTDDFWLMIWQQKPKAIVMVTKFFEEGKAKCAQYIPETVGQTLNFAGVEILYKAAEVWSDFTVNTLYLTKSEESPRTLKHFYYQSWPDHGVPSEMSSYLTFTKKVRDETDRLNGLIIVHCSAGVGRTGTYIALDYLLEQAKSEKKVNPFECIRKMRTRRPCMVQTLDQYHFLHKVLGEALATESFLCTPGDLGTRLNAYKEDKASQENTILKEFQRIQTHMDSIDRSYSIAKSEENIDKNRFPDKLADAHHGIYVGGGYINAVLADDCRRKNWVIATQLPLSTTINDFWQMIMDRGVKVVVQLQDQDTSFYPSVDKNTKDYGKGLVVTRTDSVRKEDMSVIQLTLKTATKCIQVTVLCTNSWVEDESSRFPNSASLLRSLGMLEKLQRESGDNRICITDMDGSTRCGTFLCAYNAVERLKADQETDIYTAVLQAKYRRPEFVPDLENYVFLYKLLKDFTDEFSDYANFQQIDDCVNNPETANEDSSVHTDQIYANM